MPNAYFTAGSSSPDRTATFSASNQSNVITTDTARLASNGNRPMKIVQVRMYLAGRNSSRTCSIGMTGGYNGSTGNFTVAQGSAAANTGFKAINTGISSTPASSTVSLSVSGETYMGNDLTGGSNSVAGISGRTLWGEYTYVQVPATPSTPSVTGNQANSSVTVSWSGNSDWGSSSSGLGYTVELFLNGSSYTSIDTTSTSHTFNSMPAGYTYTARIYAYNELTSFSGSPKSTVSGTSSGYFLPAPIVYYTVSFNSNGGSNNPSSVSVQSGSTTTLPSPGTRSGYSFNGWVSSYNGGVYGAGQQSHAIVSNTTFTASWTQLTWTVTFNGNGGTTPSSQTVNQGSSLPGGLPSSSRAGYTLLGWYTAPSGGSSVGAAGAPYTPSSNITLYAQWQALTPGFEDEQISTSIFINQDFSEAADHSVFATNATSYSINYAGFGLNPTWLSISSGGDLSGSTSIVGTYNFTVTATGSGGSATSNVLSITVIHPGKRYDPATASLINFTNGAYRYDSQSGFVPLTIMKRYNGSSWEDIS